MKCACETDPDGSIRSLCAAHENKAAALYDDADLIRQLQRDVGRKGRLIQTLHELVAQEIGRPGPPPDRIAGEPPRVHVVKSVSPYFADVYEGRKTFEVRKDDRDYRVGDILIQREFDAALNAYTGRRAHARIGYKLDDPGHVLPGHCVLGLVDITVD